MTNETKQVAYKIASIDEKGAFQGYASTYGTIDAVGEIVAPGAFDDVLGQLQVGMVYPPIMWEHDKAMPVGEQIITSDETGLVVDGQLWIDTLEDARKAYKLLSKTTYFMSFWATYDDSFVNPDGNTVITHINSLYETTITAHPANREAEILVVKSLSELDQALASWIKELKQS